MKEMVKNKDIFTIKDLAITGEDVMNKLNIKPSKAIGEILKKALLFVMEDPKNNEKEILLNYIGDLHLREPQALV